jgi:hypothetical protein
MYAVQEWRTDERSALIRRHAVLGRAVAGPTVFDCRRLLHCPWAAQSRESRDSVRRK